MAELSAKQEKAIVALMSSSTIAQAAESVSVAPRTIYTWLEDSAFSEAYRAARRDATLIATARLQQISGAAVERLEHLLTHGTPAVQLGAAKTILEMSVKTLEVDDQEARLAALEKRNEQKL